MLILMTKPVGFDQKVLLHHLDYTAKLINRHSRKEMYGLLDGYLRSDITGIKSRKNAITMLMKIWYFVDDSLIPIRDKVLHIFNDLTKEERLFVHWGMTLAAYPFFQAIVKEFGRLFQLQEDIPSVVIGKRMKDLYGDRRRVEVATSAVLTSLKFWGIILPHGRHSYRESTKINITNPLLQEFLVQILLYTSGNKALYIDIVENHVLFFPFSYILDIHKLRESHELRFYYEGIKNLVVEKA